ncbi:MAG: type IV secretion system protein [Sphingomonas sp.]|uniref:type IV secretion system protein n=1 Tax=Sphingomonas sp. TaxID=28214 RepID=UPI002273EDEE|nr:type IV secretion system protein [Sphingomonas sp.]MCX8477451.1 type IV secretion system protein [Sphingomonas sp.]
MTMACPSITDGAFLQSVLQFVDCQAQSLGSQGYLALSAPGSPLSLLLTGMLTLFVAFFGYRMLFGDMPGVRDGVVALVKIGVVLALATSWTAYRTLAYDVAFHGPAELVAGVGAPAGLPGASGDLAVRLELVDDALIELGRLGNGPAAAVRTGVDGQQVVTPIPTEPPSIFTPFALGTARLVFLTATIAGFASVRLVAGLLLALGPFFIAFLLFEGTRGLFEGWIRGLAAAVIGAIAVTLLLMVELALLEPWLAELIARREAQFAIGGAATELLVVALAFALALLAGLGMAARLVLGFRLPLAWRMAPAQMMAGWRGGAAQPIQPARETHVPAAQLSRAAAVAEAVAHVQRREATAAQTASPGTASHSAITKASGRDMPPSPPTPLGQSHRRRTQSRVSTSAGRRDKAR